MKLTVALLAFFAATASSATVPRASSKCHSIGSHYKGYLATFPGENPTKWVAVGLNKKDQVTYGASDPLFEECPKLPEDAPDVKWFKGRIIVSGSNNCVTVTNPNDPEGGPFFLAVKKCGDDVIPPASQQWEWGNDFGDVVFWVRSMPEATVIVQLPGEKKLMHPRGKSEGDEIGYTIDDNSNPVTESGTHRIELGCANSCSSFGIKPKSQLN
ncbi:hypothetical protein FRC04_004253 [Tulasnella sp. 424]|nr:hypothetical protein FRC04_004253 [Tulasnella sp. 424]KAG8979377.1 hypothetical protein FRC05_008362 [Tulasnella sp. 425]